MSNRFGQHQHICGLYENEEEALATAAEYLAEGFWRGERCSYVAGSRAALTRFRAALEDLGLDAETMISSGALIEATSAEVYLLDGRFDTERMVGLVDKAVENALKAGFSGLCACGDMSWLLEGRPGSTEVVEYEAFLNHFLQRARAAALCLYDRRRLPPHLLDYALATHPSAVLEGQHRTNPFYRVPSIAARRPAQPHKVEWKIGELRRVREQPS
jgi:DcmR-like sensory protein